MFSFFSMNYIYSPREAFLNNYVATIWHYQFDKITWVLFKEKKKKRSELSEALAHSRCLKRFCYAISPTKSHQRKKSDIQVGFPSQHDHLGQCQIAHGPGGCYKFCGAGMWLASVKSLFKNYHHNILLHHNHHNLHKVHLHKIR